MKTFAYLLMLLLVCDAMQAWGLRRTKSAKVGPKSSKPKSILKKTNSNKSKKSGLFSRSSKNKSKNKKSVRFNNNVTVHNVKNSHYSNTRGRKVRRLLYETRK